MRHRFRTRVGLDVRSLHQLGRHEGAQGSRRELLMSEKLLNHNQECTVIKHVCRTGVP